MKNRAFERGIGLALALWAVWPSAGYAAAPGSSGVVWNATMDAGLADAGKRGRPILLDFYVDW